MTDRELATVLAALRYWQYESTEYQRTYGAHFTDENDEPRWAPMTDAEIDALCERLNTEPTA